MQGRFARLVAAVVGVTAIACGSNDLAAPPGSATEDTPGERHAGDHGAPRRRSRPGGTRTSRPMAAAPTPGRPTRTIGWSRPPAGCTRRRSCSTPRCSYNGHPRCDGRRRRQAVGRLQYRSPISASYKMPAAREVWMEVVHKFGVTGTTRTRMRLRGVQVASSRCAPRPDGGIGNGHLGSSWGARARSRRCSAARNLLLTGGVRELPVGLRVRSVAVPRIDSRQALGWPVDVYRVHVRFPGVKGEKTGTFEIWVDGVKCSAATIGPSFTRATAISAPLRGVNAGEHSNSGTLVAHADLVGAPRRSGSTSPGW